MAEIHDARSVFPGFDQLRDDLVDVIDDLAVRRRAAGLSQTEVAARMGTSQSAVARLEAGRDDVRVSTLERYAQALGLTVRFGVAPLDRARDA
jgi:transcriptional regulator with XRE-family HTH domain